MRLSGLVIATILWVSASLLAQHSSAGGSSSGGSSHGGYSGGSSVSSASSHTSSASASHVGITSATSRQPSSFSKSPPANGKPSPEKKSSRSFLHLFRKPQPVQSAGLKRPTPCLKGKCPVCPPGEARGGSGACVVANNMCAAGQSWNGFACSTQYWFNDCSALASQLAAQQRRMRGQSDPGQALMYRLLRQQYESCLARYGSHTFSDAFLFDTLPYYP